MRLHQGTSPRRALLVLGMHRSGTSAVTRTLGLRGAALPLHAAPASFDNETGFWEPLEIVRLHDEILQSAGSSWDDPAAFPAGWFASDAAQRFQTRLSDALMRDFPDNPPLFAVKDPRLCRLVPLWLKILQDLGIEPLFVIPVRNPLEIAASLRKRNCLQEEHSLLLWLRHFLAAERATRHCRRSLICYAGLLGDWRATIDKIGQDLEVNWPRQSPAADVEITQFISTALRHHHYPDEEVYSRANVAVWVKQAFSWALRATDRPTGDFAALDAISTELDAADVAFTPIIADSRLSITRLNHEVELLGRRQTEFLQSRNRRADDLRRLRDQLQANQAALRRLHAEVARQAESAKELRNELQSARAANQQAADEAAAIGLRNENLQAAYDQLQAELDTVRHRYDRIVTSTMWRGLAPVRSVAAAVPAGLRMQMRRAAKALYWLATLHKTAQRLRFLRARRTDAAALPRGLDATANLVFPAHGLAAVDAASPPADRPPADRPLADRPLAADPPAADPPADRPLAAGPPADPAPSAFPGSAVWPLLVPLGHFYSPVVDPREIRKREARLWSSPDVVEGVDLNLAAQLALLKQLRAYTSTIDYPVDDPGDDQTYFYSNEQYPVLDAEFLHAALVFFKPKAVIEVGSGFSSLVTAGVNRKLMKNNLDFSCIEPYPRQFLIDGVDGITRVIQEKVEDVELSFFDRLHAGDFLFVDSSHVSKVGSDVNYLFFDVFPRLKPGVIIHIHDIFLPDEYPKEWMLDHGRNWNEQYLVRAFMQYNRSFEVIWAANYMGTRHLSAVQETFPRYPAFGGGGSFWIRKTG